MEEIRNRINAIESMLIQAGIDDEEDLLDIMDEIKDLAHYSIVYGRTVNKQ